MDMFAGGD